MKLKRTAWGRAGEGASTPGYHPESPVHQKLSQAGSEEDEASPLSELAAEDEGRDSGQAGDGAGASPTAPELFSTLEEYRGQRQALLGEATQRGDESGQEMGSEAGSAERGDAESAPEARKPGQLVTKRPTNVNAQRQTRPRSVPPRRGSGHMSYSQMRAVSRDRRDRARAAKRKEQQASKVPLREAAATKKTAGSKDEQPRMTGAALDTLTMFLSILCPSGLGCTIPLLLIASGAIPTTPHLSCGECGQSFCGYELVSRPPFLGQDKSTLSKAWSSPALATHLEGCSSMDSTVRPEARWGELLLNYIRKGYSMMTPGQQATLSTSYHELCEEAHHVTVTEPLLRELGLEAASVEMGAWPAPIKYGPCTSAFLETLTIVCNRTLEEGNTCYGVLAKFYGRELDKLPLQSAWKCPDCDMYQCGREMLNGNERNNRWGSAGSMWHHILNHCELPDEVEPTEHWQEVLRAHIARAVGAYNDEVDIIELPAAEIEHATKSLLFLTGTVKRESRTGGITWDEAEADEANSGHTEAEVYEDKQGGGGAGSDEHSGAQSESESQTGRRSQQASSQPDEAAIDLGDPTGSYLRSRVASLSVDSCPGCASKSEEGDGCDTHLLACNGAPTACNVKTYCALCRAPFRLRSAAAGWSGKVCTCKSFLASDPNFDLRWTGEWKHAVERLADEITDEMRLRVLGVLTKLISEIMAEKTIQIGTEHWAQRFLRLALPALYDSLAVKQNALEASKAADEQAHRLNQEQWQVAAEAAARAEWEVDKPELAGMSCDTLAAVTNRCMSEVIPLLLKGEDHAPSRILLALAETMDRPLKIIKANEGIDGGYSMQTIGERADTGANFCLVQWFNLYWTCHPVVVKPKAVNDVRDEPGWCGLPCVLDSEQARLLGFRYLVGSVAQGTTGRNSWNDINAFWKQCYGRNQGWRTRESDFALIADSLSSSGSSVVDGVLRIDGMHLLSRKQYDAGVGTVAREGVAGLGLSSMRQVYDAQVRKQFGRLHSRTLGTMVRLSLMSEEESSTPRFATAMDDILELPRLARSKVHAGGKEHRVMTMVVKTEAAARAEERAGLGWRRLDARFVKGTHWLEEGWLPQNQSTGSLPPLPSRFKLVVECGLGQTTGGVGR